MSEPSILDFACEEHEFQTLRDAVDSYHGLAEIALSCRHHGLRERGDRQLRVSLSVIFGFENRVVMSKHIMRWCDSLSDAEAVFAHFTSVLGPNRADPFDTRSRRLEVRIVAQINEVPSNCDAHELPDAETEFKFALSDPPPTGAVEMRVMN